MALADVLGRASFADLLNVADVKFSPQWSQQRSMTGGGDVIYADLGPMLWRAEVTTVPMTYAQAKLRMALINSRAGGLKSLQLYDHSAQYPTSDPTGSIFGSATPVVGTITNRYVAAFTGFPASYVIPQGTWLQIVFDTTRRYIGQFCEAITANGSGAVAAVELAPALPDGIVSGDVVQLKQPAGKFRIIPGSAAINPVDVLNAVLSFSAEQTYAA